MNPGSPVGGTSAVAGTAGTKARTAARGGPRWSGGGQRPARATTGETRSRAARRPNLAVTLAMALVLGGCTAPVLRLASEKPGPEQLVNGQFRVQADRFPGWDPWQDRCGSGPGRGGGTAAWCANPEPRQAGIGQWLPLNQVAPAPVLVKGWSRARNVSGSRDSEYSLYVDVICTDGDPIWGLNAPFDPGTHDWQEQQLLVRVGRPIRQLRVYGLFRGRTGEAWFDDFSVRPLLTGGLFDGLAVKPPVARPAVAGYRATTGNGLSVYHDDATGTVAEVSVGDRTLTPAGRTGGWMARDVAAGSDWYGFQDGLCQALGLRLEVQWEAQADHLRLKGRLVDLRGGDGAHRSDRAVTLALALPVGQPGWQWYRGLRGRVPIQPGREYADCTSIGTGSGGAMSLYPWAAIGDSATALVLAVDPARPVQHRLGYSAATGWFYVSLDLGLVAETRAFPHAAPIDLVIASVAPRWGFRAAAAAVYRAFPDAFVCRSPQQGIWMPFTDISTLPQPEDFGFRYHEGDNNVAFDDQAGVLSFRYTEPSTWWMPMPPEVPRTHDGVMSVLRQRLAEGDRRAQAVEVSGSYGRDGRLQYQVRREPWCDGAVFSTNPNPQLPGLSEAAMNWNDSLRQVLYGPDAAGVLDGEYLDSVEGYVTATENWRREHFAYVTAPLTFSTLGRRPVIHKAWSNWEFADRLGRDLHGAGRLLFGNSLPQSYAFLAPSFDVMGTETNWLVDSTFTPPADDWFALKRYMTWHKPYLLLMNTDFDQLTSTRVEQYFRRCLFYGFYPSMFSYNAAEDPYWETPRWFERDRALFRRYQPLIRQVAQAGWEPVTEAWTRDAHIWIERFGPDAQGHTWLTLLNTADQPRRVEISWAAQTLGEGLQAREVLEQRPLEARPDGVSIDVASDEVLLLELQRP